MNQTPPSNPAAPRFSVVIPTYQRREIVLTSVRALARQEFDAPFEVVVVVDGSADGTGAALRALATPFPLAVIDQPNQGAASARNRGAQAARGEIVLFLDDDMRAHPRLLAEHDRAHRAGADVVMGHIPLDPASPPTIITAGVREWAEYRARRLAAPGARLTLGDLLTGQISLPKRLFEQVGGFDTTFTRGGSFGMEDVDFGYRLMRAGYTIVFNPEAISWQHYAVQPPRYLRQWRQAGQADVVFARKHPDLLAEIFPAHKLARPINRRVWRPLARLPLLAPALIGLLRWLTLREVERRPRDARSFKLFFAVRYMEYWRGVWEAGDIPRPRPPRVLAYHAIADLSNTPRFSPYGVPPEQFRRQLDTLARLGFRFVDADELLGYLRGQSGLPRRPLLLTFDDCYAELATIALPMLQERGIPAVAFAVSGLVGGMNEWDAAIGGPRLRLLDADGLRAIARGGVEVGAHSRTHRPLTRVPAGELAGEIAGSARDLAALGLPPPRLFAYPYGAYDARVLQAARSAGLQAAFTVEPGAVRAGQDAQRLPRVEIARGDLGWRLIGKILFPRAWHSLSRARARLRSALARR